MLANLNVINGDWFGPERSTDETHVQDGLNKLLEFIHAFEEWGDASKQQAIGEGLPAPLMEQFQSNHQALMSNVCE